MKLSILLLVLASSSLFAYEENLKSGRVRGIMGVGKTYTIGSHKPYSRPDEKHISAEDLPVYHAKKGYVWIHLGRKTFIALDTPDLDLLTGGMMRSNREKLNIEYKYDDTYCQSGGEEQTIEYFEYCQLIEMTITGRFPVFSQEQDKWVFKQQTRRFVFKK